MTAPMRIERLVLIDPADPRIPHRMTAVDRILSQFENSDLIIVLMFCAVGLLVTAALLIALPITGDLSDSLQSLQQSM